MKNASTGDAVDFSPSANPFLNANSQGANGSATGGTAGSSVSYQNFALTDALEATESQGSSTSFSDQTSGTTSREVVTGSLAGVLQGGTASGTVIAHPGESAADLKFANVYAAQEADGPVGRFYKGTDVSEFTTGMSDAQKASFLTAYNNHTLDIQSASDAAGVVETGTTTATISEGGASEVGSGTGSISTVQLMKTNQYVMVQVDPFFGNTVIGWGGPASSATTTS